MGPWKGGSGDWVTEWGGKRGDDWAASDQTGARGLGFSRCADRKRAP